MSRKFSKNITYKEMTDSQLEKAGWYMHGYSRVKTKIPVRDCDAESLNEASDCCLYRKNGEILVVFGDSCTTSDAGWQKANLLITSLKSKNTGPFVWILGERV